MGFGNSKVHEINVLFHGGLESGKRTIIERITGKKSDVEFNVSYKHDYEYKGHNFHIWGLKGDKTGRLWRQYTKNVQVFVLVVDGTNIKNLLDLKRDLTDAMAMPDLKDTLFMIFVNKTEEAKAFHAEQVKETLELEKITTHVWSIFDVSGNTGYGLFDGMDWIVEKVES